MACWGAEVKAGKPLKVKPDEECCIHLTQATLGKKGEYGVLYVTVDGNKFVIATLSQDKNPHISFNLVFEKEFELSHSMERGSVHFIGHKSSNIDNQYPFSFPFGISGAAASKFVKAYSKPKAKPAEVKPADDSCEEYGSEDVLLEKIVVRGIISEMKS